MLGKNCFMGEREKWELWNMWRSGKYYNKELAEWFGISTPTVAKIIEEKQEEYVRIIKRNLPPPKTTEKGMVGNPKPKANGKGR